MLKTFPSYEELRELIQLAKREDLGSDDVTSRLLVAENQIGVGTLIQKEVGIPAGLPVVEMICRTYDERLRGLLMLALYRSGRQAEALDAYAAARRVLVSELGIEPGPELQKLERRMLVQDPGLVREAVATAVVARSSGGSSARSNRRRVKPRSRPW